MNIQPGNIGYCHALVFRNTDPGLHGGLKIVAAMLNILFSWSIGPIAQFSYPLEGIPSINIHIQ